MKGCPWEHLGWWMVAWQLCHLSWSPSKSLCLHRHLCKLREVPGSDPNWAQIEQHERTHLQYWILHQQDHLGTDWNEGHAGWDQHPSRLSLQQIVDMPASILTYMERPRTTWQRFQSGQGRSERMVGDVWQHMTMLPSWKGDYVQREQQRCAMKMAVIRYSPNEDKTQSSLKSDPSDWEG